MIPPREFTLEEILTKAEIAEITRLYRRSRKGFYRDGKKWLAKREARIQWVLGPCSMHYVLYGVEYRLLKKRKGPAKRPKHRNTFEAKMYTKQKDHRSWTPPMESDIGSPSPFFG